ncbi:hypothetical protein IW140_005023 [Coemansia sp. RSA 1813]|nr:hypothetical protein EV178_004005 [Coemansia sp. RSA 1646]KAJ1768825.1 hypothetical protein LPJ74_004569 [Coemansia sp. RSA 1843]KAJ2087225.1 hypothetical protein IW138_005140 [Coemansia sp. RSA 986]KAJ2566210.1 hypothetical protein IW140_005023 [Coemansia sp. RSA 1813]
MAYSKSRQSMRFPEGVVRATKMQGVNNSPKETVTLVDILEAASLDQALLSSFLLDEEWLLGHFGHNTPITLVTNPRNNSDSANNADAKHAAPVQSKSGRLTWVHPELPKPVYQIMHSKIMVLFYRHYMRFVVSTANLIPDDWSVMQNAVFLQDFPMDRATVFPANGFSLSLAYALHDLSVPFDIVALLNNVDFSAARVRIVTTVPTGGMRQNMNMSSYGMERLSSIVAETFGKDKDKDKAAASNQPDPSNFQPNARLFCVGSSLGRMDTKWLRDFYLCAHGLDLEKLSLSFREQLAPDDTIDIGVGFHTHEDMEKCRYGEKCKAYIMLNSDVYENEKEFPRSSLCRVVPRVSDSLVHAKLVVARFGVEQRKGWVYVGSHNFTPAAWGRLRIGHVTYFNNYEFGVVLPDTQYTRITPEEITVSWDSRNIPLPFKLIWQPYARDDVPFFSK